jgi:pyruvate formate lyase activating enzyme
MDSQAVVCETCFHRCRLKEGQSGFCRARINHGGTVVPESYGMLTAAALDPIEKKPLARFFPGSKILSVGSFGCNLACPFCQNYQISQIDSKKAETRFMSPEELTELACSIPDNLGVALTYNEPLIQWEYVRDTGRLLKEKGKKVVLVSNGTASLPVLEEILPFVDAMNIDLKGDESFYKNELGGDRRMVCETIGYVYDKCHLEITTLVIPGKNDSAGFIREEARWIASLNPEIPLHLSRYFPRYRCTIAETPRETVRRLRDEAQKYLRYVYTGNMW